MKTIIAAMAMLLLTIGSSSAETYVEGTHYHTLHTPLQVPASGGIEVRYFFWYGSAHSQNMPPVINAWERRLPGGVSLVRTPAVWNELMKTHATAFYALETLRVSDNVRDAAFGEMRITKKKLSSETQLQAFYTSQGISAQAFSNAFRSYGVAQKVGQAQSMSRAAGVRGLPTFVIGGKYRVDRVNDPINPRNQLNIVDFLVNKVGNERRGY